jgi:hypothetical protein
LPKREEALLLLIEDKEVAVRRGIFCLLLLVERCRLRVVGRLPTEEAEDPIVVTEEEERLLLLIRWTNNL